MSTKAMIYIKYKEKETLRYLGLYCHFDGYLEHVGKILYNFYNSTEKIEELFKNNCISNFNDDGTVELMETDDNDPIEYNSENQFPKMIDYHYMWDTDKNKWYFSCWDYHNWKELTF